MYTSCDTSRLNLKVHSHLFLYDFGAMTLEHSGLNGGKVSDWLGPLLHGFHPESFAPMTVTISTLSMTIRSIALRSLDIGGRPTHAVHKEGGHLAVA